MFKGNNVLDAVSGALKALEACSVTDTQPQKEADTESDDDDDVPVSTTVPVFVKKLKDLVDDPQVDCASWSRDGTSFVVQEPNRLGVQLQKYFKSSKLKSFVRQLHFYGFKKTGGSRQADWVFNHKYFTRKGDTMHRLRRKSCGPEQQLKVLKLKVENLTATLAATQEKLGNMAMALGALLQHKKMAMETMTQMDVVGRSFARMMPAMAGMAAMAHLNSNMASDPQNSTASQKRSRDAMSAEVPPQLPTQRQFGFSRPSRQAPPQQRRQPLSQPAAKQARRLPPAMPSSYSDILGNGSTGSFIPDPSPSVGMDNDQDFDVDFLLTPRTAHDDAFLDLDPSQSNMVVHAMA